MFYVRTTWPWGILAWSLAGSTALATPVHSNGTRPEIRIVRDQQQRPIAVEAVGLPQAELHVLREPDADPADFIMRFYVSVETSAAAGLEQTVPAVAGTYSIEETVVRFTPRYPLVPGVDYRVTVQWEPADSSGLSRSTSWEKTEAAFAVPGNAGQSRPAVENVFPSGPTIPENHLRFYIHFSRPMKRGSAYRFLELRDETGQVLEGSFLELAEELWDPQQTRLTLLLDPGRVKQSLKPREELGPVLKQAQKYQLIVRAGWADANGIQLATDFEHEFAVGPPANEFLDVQRWTLSEPREGTADPLSIRSPVPLDHALALRSITVRNADGDPVPGEVALKDGETTVQFTPSIEWTHGDYSLAIDPRLEDTAGNNVEAAFEVEHRFDRTDLNRSVSDRAILLPVQITVSAEN